MTAKRRHPVAGDSDPVAGVPDTGAPIDPQLESDLAAELELDPAADLEALRAEAETNLELARRKQAEFENYRKRVTREQADVRDRASQRVIEELLPALDNLERAIDHTTAGGDLGELLRGVEMVHQQIMDVFGKEGVELQDPLGESFDPALHQAVGQHEDPAVPTGTVIEVYHKGFVMGGRVLRPASVVVSTGGPAPDVEDRDGR